MNRLRSSLPENFLTIFILAKGLLHRASRRIFMQQSLRKEMVADAAKLYLDLMKRCLTNWIYGDFDQQIRVEGRDWPDKGHTMIGLKRLNNLQFCLEDVLTNNVPGDLIEAGVWRGGATIFM